jgi:2-oxoisovalerate dehydrogenase E1 component
MIRRAFSTSRLAGLRAQRSDEIAALAEVRQQGIFVQKLRDGSCELPEGRASLDEAGMSASRMLVNIQAGFCTNLLHTQSRIASLLGEGFYTIGPCGEEMLSAVGANLRQTDAVALHYRHLSTQLGRQLNSGERTAEDILLDRARGYTCSIADPATGGAHCAIGGGAHDFLVTSTLASQSPPAVGRALGGQLANQLNLQSSNPSTLPFPSDFVSYVSLGDGSVNNAHFITAGNMAEYAVHRNIKCPVVFGISDNDRCISLRGYGWLQKFLDSRFGKMQTFHADGRNLLDVHYQSDQAIAYSRRTGKPSIIVYSNIARRFGHAATDRQAAYLDQEEIDAAEAADVLEGACAQAVGAGVISYAELLQMFEGLEGATVAAFDTAAEETKLGSLGRDELNRRANAALVDVPNTAAEESAGGDAEAAKKPLGRRSGRLLMRKAMNNVISEALEQGVIGAGDRRVVYLGEDVEHGGYYLVSDGLKKKFPLQVRDFPPDETGLMGAAIGFAQAGLIPVVEIPYAKYLDCGADMFFEAAIAHWLSNGEQPNGMMVRLQGFDKGIFGGNFHTHNTVHMPPGLDVICHSNGFDYAAGWRYALAQASAGRMVMSVDSTALLNQRHLHMGPEGKGDDGWLCGFPDPGEVMTFDQVRTYSPPTTAQSGGSAGARLAVVSYGNGIPTALQAAASLRDEHGVADVTVIDCPYIGGPLGLPSGLVNALADGGGGVTGSCNFDGVVFADVCKEGQHPLASTIIKLHSLGGVLPSDGRWRSVAAQPTYNPLGSTATFLSTQDIVEACLAIA